MFCDLGFLLHELEGIRPREFFDLLLQNLVAHLQLNEFIVRIVVLSRLLRTTIGASRFGLRALSQNYLVLIVEVVVFGLKQVDAVPLELHHLPELLHRRVHVGSRQFGDKLVHHETIVLSQNVVFLLEVDHVSLEFFHERQFAAAQIVLCRGLGSRLLWSPRLQWNFVHGVVRLLLLFWLRDFTLFIAHKLLEKVHFYS